MLVLSRKENQRLLIGDEIIVEVVEISGGKVKIGITAPRSTPVHREEVAERIKAEAGKVKVL